LRILDHGIKRRQQSQLKQADTDSCSTPTTLASLTRTTSQESSQISSPVGTTGASAADEEIIKTPNERPSDSYYHKTALILFDGAVSALGKTPPSTSPYTDPLQTIPSQADLFLQPQDAIPLPTSDSNAISRLSAMNRRLSDLHMAHIAHTEAHCGEESSAPESTRNSLIELLNEYEREDRSLSNQGLPALDEKSREHITGTLSTLEGKGSPLMTDIDNETLLRMFGHLKRGLEKVPKLADPHESDVVADRYCNKADGGKPGPAAALSEDFDDESQAELGLDSTEHKEAGPRPTPVLTITSKWSSSTLSLKDPTRALRQKMSRGLNVSGSATKTSGSVRKDSPRSIGYPSRIPGKVPVPNGSTAVTSSEIARRQSSPTLGKGRPGSVRVAREALRKKGSTPQTIMSSGSKKTPRSADSRTKAYLPDDGGYRGRTPSAEKANSGSNGAGGPKVTPSKALSVSSQLIVMQTPRARSKSKYVLDKINGLFSGKRDKKGTAIPSVPAIRGRDSADRAVEIAPNGSPVLRSPEVPTRPKMPTLKLSDHPALHSASSATSSISPEAPVDSVVASGESIALQDCAESFLDSAQRETNSVRKERLLNFAKVRCVGIAADRDQTDTP